MNLQQCMCSLDIVTRAKAVEHEIKLGIITYYCLHKYGATVPHLFEFQYS